MRRAQAWRAVRRALPALLLALALAPAALAQTARPPLVAELSQSRIEITTGFSGTEILVFGATERMIGLDGDEVIVLVQGPTQPIVVRRKVQLLGLWVNGPWARFPFVPNFYAVAGTRAPWELLPETERVEARIGLDNLPLRVEGQRAPAFRAALLALKQERGLWVEQVEPVATSGGRLFHVRLPLPATVMPGEYRVSALLVREGQIVARQELPLAVERVGTAAGIAEFARGQPLLYGLSCVALAALLGWFGGMVFRRS